jgi:hypothetical protein
MRLVDPFTGSTFVVEMSVITVPDGATSGILRTRRASRRGQPHRGRDRQCARSDVYYASQ